LIGLRPLTLFHDGAVAGTEVAGGSA